MPPLAASVPRMLVFAAALVTVAVMVTPAGAGAQGDPGPGDPPRVLVSTITGSIGPVTADHLGDGIGRAESGGYAAYVVLLDTPGGLDTSMRAIIQRVLEAEVPVMVLVAPRGARAASAGALITSAAHVAAMAPGTAIGAATPVGLEGGDLDDKVLNDAIALARSLAELRDRNVDFAVEMVSEARSASAAEALQLGAIDLIAASVDELLDEVDGTEVTLRGDRTVVLETAEATVDTYDMGLFRRILQVLADPNLAFLFLSIGTLGIIYELASPGAGAGGAIGVALIVLALFSLSVLPVDVTGLVFLALAVVLFGAELYAPGVGVFAFLGAGSLALSGMFLFDDEPGLEVSLAVLLPTALVVGGATIVAGRLAMRIRTAPSTTTGTGTLLGETVTIRQVDGDDLWALVQGSWWRVRASTSLAVGDRALVTDVDGLTLVVEPLGDSGSAAETTGGQPEKTHHGGSNDG